MIEYRMMDENCILASCLHNGPITLYTDFKTAWAEQKYGLQESIIARFLNDLCRVYGSCGVMAIENRLVVAKIRFCPQSLLDTFSEKYLCVQAEDGARFIESLDSTSLPPKDKLSSKDIFILCFQTHSSYRGQGIAAEMVKTLIHWAKENGWEHIRAKALQNIKPLLYLTGMWSIEHYQRLGFQVTGSTHSEELKNAIVAMKSGEYGLEIKTQWQQYEHYSDHKASTLYDVNLTN